MFNPHIVGKPTYNDLNEIPIYLPEYDNVNNFEEESSSPSSLIVELNITTKHIKDGIVLYFNDSDNVKKISKLYSNNLFIVIHKSLKKYGDITETRGVIYRDKLSDEDIDIIKNRVSIAIIDNNNEHFNCLSIIKPRYSIINIVDKIKSPTGKILITSSEVVRVLVKSGDLENMIKYKTSIIKMAIRQCLYTLSTHAYKQDVISNNIDNCFVCSYTVYTVKNYLLKTGKNSEYDNVAALIEKIL
jgi:hypothetical protein